MDICDTSKKMKAILDQIVSNILIKKRELKQMQKVLEDIKAYLPLDDPKLEEKDDQKKWNESISIASNSMTRSIDYE